MPEYGLETGKLLIHNSKKSNSFIFSSLYSFRLQKEGFLIMLGEIRPNNKESGEILELIFESFKNYFQNQKTDTDNLELYFEDALQKTNQELQIELIKHNKKDWLDKCSLILAVLKNDMIHFTYIGSNLDLFLVRKNKLIDLLKDKLNNKINPLKIFSHIISGNVEKDDFFLFSNSTLLDYFSQEKIKKIILDYPPKKALDYFKTLIGPELNSKNSLITLLTKVVAKKRDLAQIEVKEEIKEEVIIPPPAIETKNEVILSKKFTYLKEKLSFLLRMLKIILNKIINFISSINFGNIISRFKFSWENSKTKFRNLSSYHKIVLLTSLFLLLLFIQSLAFLGGGQLAKKQKNDAENIKKEIQSKQLSADISINYKDKEKAKKYLEEITLLISKLPSKTDEEKKFINDLKSKNQSQLNELNGISSAKTTTIAKFSSSDQNLQMEKIMLFDQNIYGVDFKNNLISQTDLNNKNTIYYKIDSKENFNNVALLDKDNVLFSTLNGNLFKFSLRDKKSYSLYLESNQEKIVRDIKIYQGKLYLLDSKNNRIAKYQKTSEGFNQEQNWLKETMPSGYFDSSSFAINGSIYVLKNDGQIIKFYMGKKINFQISELSGSSLKPLKIFTAAESESLYILDSLNKKIIITDENGRIEQQLVNEKFGEAKDLLAIKKPSIPSNNKVIEGKENKIYLLTDTELLEIKI